MRNLFLQGRVSTSVFVIAALLSAVFIYSGCSSTGDDVQSFRRGDSEKADKILSFYEVENGNESHWKVHFKEGEISSVYKDGVKLSQSEIENYSGLIDDKVSDLKSRSRDKNKKFRVFKHGDQLPLEMKKLTEGLKDQKFKIKAKIDKDIKDEMKQLSIEIKKLKDGDVELWIDKDNMDKEWDFNFKFDSEKFDKEMEELSEQLKEIEIDIDIPEIEIDMSDLDESLKDLDIKLKDLDKDLEGIENFFDELKSELVKDGLAGSEDDQIKMNIKEGKMYVNDKVVPDELMTKYKEIYKKHTGKDLEKQHFFHIN